VGYWATHLLEPKIHSKARLRISDNDINLWLEVWKRNQLKTVKNKKSLTDLKKIQVETRKIGLGSVQNLKSITIDNDIKHAGKIS
jgi:hypothetical protein